jgi:histidine ammonia-lyase
MNPEILSKLSNGHFSIDLTEKTWERIRNKRTSLEQLIKTSTVPLGGITTGVGYSSHLQIKI